MKSIKSIRRTVLLAVAAFAMTLQSCSETISPLQTSPRFASTYIPAGSSNPLMYYGDFHNSALEFYVTNYGTATRTQEAIEDSIFNFVGDSMTFVSPDWNTYADDIIDLNATKTYGQMCSDGLIGGELSGVEYNYLVEIGNAFDSLETYTDSATFINRLKQIEGHILANAADTNKDIPLAVCAVMQGSFYYWNHQENIGNSSPWASVLQNRSSGKGAVVLISERSQNIIDADVGGFLGGLLYYAIRATIIVLASGGTATIPAIVDILLESAAAGAISSCITALYQ